MSTRPSWLPRFGPGHTLFLDRDGVLNRRLPDDYVKRWEEWEWLPGVLEALPVLARVFGRIVVVTNQRGIARGLYTEEGLAQIHARMLADAEAAGGRIDAVYFCPHGKDTGCDCRKPKPGMLLRAAAELPGVDLGQAILVGDSLSDLQAAQAAGVPAIYVGEPGIALPENTLGSLPGLAALATALDTPPSNTAMSLDADFWNNRWIDSDTPWDIGYASPAITGYLSALPDRELRILVPGAGSGYEAEWMWRNGFRNVHVLDFSPLALAKLQQRCPDFPPEQLIAGDFFAHAAQYDLVVEQTFFCAIDVALRPAYAAHMHQLLAPGGRLAGLLFDFPLTEQGPPFGGSAEEYLGYFAPHFDVLKMERCTNSIKPREGRELWVELRRKA